MGQGRRDPQPEEHGIERSCADAAPSVGCSWDRHKGKFSTPVARLKLDLNVKLLIEIDPPFDLSIKIKGNRSSKGKSRPDMGLHTTLQSVLQPWYS